MNNALMQQINICIRSINLQNLEKFFFAFFLLSIPVQTRLTFYSPQTYSNGSFNEYATFFLYLSDILLITTLFIYFVNTLTFKYFFSIVIQRIHSFPHLIPTNFIFITLITWSFINVFWSEYRNLAFYQFIKLIEFALFLLYARNRLRWFGYSKVISLIFISGFLESIIGISQYYLQKSLGLKFLMESVLSPEIPNVAKIVVDGERIIRAYGTFPHPNIFSGFLLFSIFWGFWLLFSYKTLKAYKIVSRETILYAFILIGLIIQLTALILTFSRITWLASILIAFIFLIIVSRSKLFHACPPKQSNQINSLTLSKSNKLFHVKQFKILRKGIKQFYNLIIQKTFIVSIMSILISLLVVIGFNWKQVINRVSITQSNYQESADNRTLYNNIAINIITLHPLTGLGGKNFTVRMQEFTNKHLELWQFQPAHNIYLLIASELGLIGLSLFMILIYLVIKNSWSNINKQIVSRLPSEANSIKVEDNIKENKEIVSRETISIQANEGETILLQTGLISVLTGFLFIGLFDHYFWTLQQGQLTFWLVLGIIASLNHKSVL